MGIYEWFYVGAGVTLPRIIFMLSSIFIVILFIWMTYFGRFRNTDLRIRKRSVQSGYSDIDEYYLITTRKRMLIKNLVIYLVINMILSMIPVVWMFLLISQIVINKINTDLFNVYNNIYLPWKRNGYSTLILLIIIISIFIISILFSLKVHDRFIWFLQDLLKTTY